MSLLIIIVIITIIIIMMMMIIIIIVTISIINQTFFKEKFLAFFQYFLSCVDLGQEIVWIIIIQSRDQILSKVENIKTLEFSKESFFWLFKIYSIPN